MNRIVRFVLISVLAFPALVNGAENWHIKPYDSTFDVGGMTGMGILDGRVGYEIRGTAAVKLMNKGFFPDITNQLFLEFQPGILFISGATGFTYSLHLRWDFVMTDDWTFYALGGFGGDITGHTLGDRVEFYPRFGIGARWNVFANFGFRAELSHEFTGLGVIVPLPI